MNLDELADSIGKQLVADIEGLTLSTKVKAYKWSAGPTGFDSRPAAVVQIPTIERSPLDGIEDHIGQLTYHMTFGTFFFFDASDVTFTMPQALETVAAFIEKLNAEPTLGLSGNVQEAKVIRSEPQNVETSGGVELFGYSCEVEVLAFLST